MDGRVALPFMSAYAATRGALASYVQGANRELAGTDVVLSFFGPVPSNTESESPYFDMWRKMGVALCEPDVVAREILATIRKRQKAHTRCCGTDSIVEGRADVGMSSRPSHIFHLFAGVGALKQAQHLR
jgi:short-subunit dehydrogenase